MSGDTRRGTLFAVAAYGLWGLMPLYFVALRPVPPRELLAHRIVWCGVLIAVLLLAVGRLRDLASALRTPAIVRTFFASALLLSCNWFIYIYGVTSGQAIETSLGYFINPLLNIVLGMMFFGERLRRRQAVAVLLASAGVMVQVIASWRPPWIALTLALSFGLYGLIRKRAASDTLLGLAIETIVLLPAAVVYLTYLAVSGNTVVGTIDGHTLALLLASGVVTAVPLLCFGLAARLLPLSMLGFIQYLGPTLQFLAAVFVIGEEVPRVKWVSFGLIWLALVVYSADALATARKPEPAPATPLD